jgi:type II secretion system (T2SS) protein E
MADIKMLGEMLKEAALIDDFQLQSSLSHQRNWGGKLGSILIELEFIKEKDLARVLSERLGIPYVDPFDLHIPESVINLIKPEVAKKYQVLPARKEKGTLVLVMSDPLAIESMDAIRFITGLEIKPALALESEIRDAIRKYYDHEEFERKQSTGSPFHPRGPNASGKMEIIYGSDLNLPKTESGDEVSSLIVSGKSFEAGGGG